MNLFEFLSFLWSLHSLHLSCRQLKLSDKYWIRKAAEGPVLLFECPKNCVCVRSMKSSREVVLLLDTEIDRELAAGSLSFRRLVELQVWIQGLRVGGELLQAPKA